MRMGIGYDIRALKRGRRLVLGGVEIPHGKGLAGHSDGDALWHAVLDAVLGAMGEGDIGELFPDTDPSHRGVAGAVFAREVATRLKRRRLRVAHVDSVVIAEAPKLGAFKRRIRESLARPRTAGFACRHEGQDQRRVRGRRKEKGHRLPRGRGPRSRSIGVAWKP